MLLLQVGHIVRTLWHIVVSCSGTAVVLFLEIMLIVFCVWYTFFSILLRVRNCHVRQTVTRDNGYCDFPVDVATKAILWIYRSQQSELVYLKEESLILMSLILCPVLFSFHYRECRAKLDRWKSVPG